MRTLSITFIKKFFRLHFGGSRRAPQLRLHKEEKTARGDGDSATETAQRDRTQPLPLIPTKDELPPYYTPIDIWVDGELLEGWHRLSDGDKDFYYGNTKDNRIIFSEEVHWWCKRPGMTYPKYEPMTADDIREFSRRDIITMIKQMEENLIDVTQENIDPVARLTYNTGVQECITIVKRHTGIYHRNTDRFGSPGKEGRLGTPGN